jgi:hypothetical protein
MNTSESIHALRRANPRTKAGFAQSVEAAAEAVRTQLPADSCAPEWRAGHSSPRRRLVGLSAAGASLAAVAVVAAFRIVGWPGSGAGVESAAAAFRKAATVTAASAERSGIAVVRITHNGELWAGNTLRWHGGDLAVSSDAPRRPGRRAGSELLLVDGTLYGVEPRDGARVWVVFGSPKSIDPESGTTPDEYLAAVRVDVGGVTLRRFTDGMTGLTTTRLGDGSTVYRGKVAAGLIARETGFKEGKQIRVLPFGYVAHDEAADPGSPLDTAVTVGADGVVREISVTWGAGKSAWAYTVTYSRLGATGALVAPKNPRSLRDRTPAEQPRPGT